jgi:hypothetical protein
MGCKRKLPRLMPSIIVVSPVFAFQSVNHFV